MTAWARQICSKLLSERDTPPGINPGNLNDQDNSLRSAVPFLVPAVVEWFMPYRRVVYDLQGYLAHKKTPTPLGTP